MQIKSPHQQDASLTLPESRVVTEPDNVGQ